MQYSFRLAQLLGHDPDPKKRPGTIKAIVEYTGLDRHQVAALLKNEVKYIPLKALSRLCDYLVEHGHVPADRLPGALFAVEPAHFWEMLARRQRLDLCLGVRQHDEDAAVAWIVAADSILMGELLNGVSTLGGTARLRDEGLAESPPHPELLKQTLVWSPGHKGRDEVERRAAEAYDFFATPSGDKALVCLGSAKSNPVGELVMANAFGCMPYQALSVESARQRPCPIFVRYRARDPHPESCWGGLQLSADVDSSQPGVYYETADGKWDCCPSVGELDTAFVFYVHRESQGRLEMAMGGFSGRATRLLAKTLASRAEEFWPPVYDMNGLQVGAFVVQFTFADDDVESSDILSTDLQAGVKVIRLDESVIAARV